MADSGIVLLFKRTRAKIDTLELDASLSESHEYGADITDHEVERGSNIADHKRVKPKMLTMTGLVSNAPIYPEPGEPIQGKPGRAENALAILDALNESTIPITVVTGIRTYTDMLMSGLSVPRDITVGDALRFTATLKQIRQVENETTFVTRTILAKGKGKVSLGKQQAVKLTSASGTAEKRVSAAAEIYEFTKKQLGL